MSTAPRISAILPAHNEEGVIAGVVQRTAAALLDSRVPEPEIVVVDDGSTDRTAELVASVSTPGVATRVVSHQVNRGYGAALRTGFESATGDALWLMDSDGQFDPAELTRLLDEYRPGRLVCGYRIQRRDNAVRRLNSAAFFTLVHAAVGPTVRDVNCGFKLFPAAVGNGLRADGALISTELVVRAIRSGYEVVEVGVQHYPRTRGQASGGDPRVVARAFAELWQLRRNLDSLNGLNPPG